MRQDRARVQSRMQMKSAATAAALAFLAGIAVPFLQTGHPLPEAPVSRGSLLDYKTEIALLENAFEKNKTEAAYEYFKRRYHDADPEAIHGIAHWVGKKLYLQKGTAGAAFCDSAFSWGCFHGFYGTAISQEGNDFLLKAEKICLGDAKDPSRFGGCVHGLGHGVMEIYGYRLEDLKKALAHCDLLPQPSSKEGCYNGVFMEYNMRTMDEGSAVRELDEGNPYVPCPTLEEKFQPFCYYELPSWWIIFPNVGFEIMGGYCRRADTDANREQCFRGIGRMAYSKSAFSDSLGYDSGFVRDACQAMNVGSGKAFCISEAVRLLLSEKRTTALDLCDALGDGEEACRAQGEAFTCRIFGQCAN